LVEGNLEEATAVRKAIALLRQAIRSSPGENTGTAKPESIRGDLVVMEKLMINVDWDELNHIEMVKTVVEVEDCCMKIDRHEADQSSLYANPL
ncbi:hypothetical protein Tco_0439583, partial [Tanacetum coccineum]